MNVVNIIADMGVPEITSAQIINCAAPAYTSKQSKIISNILNPDATATIPKDRPTPA